MTKFQIYEDVAGQFRWRLIAGNGEKVAASEAYTERYNALRSARRVKEIAGSAIVEDDSTTNLIRLLIKKRSEQ